MALTASGCGGKAKKNATPPPVNDFTVKRVANTGPGSAVRFTDKAPRAKAWSIAWEGARLESVDSGKVAGQMTNVKGEVFRADGVASTFAAKEAQADEATGQLVLKTQVEVRASNPEAVLRCDVLLWDPASQTLQASGNVTIEGSWGTYSSSQPIWASSDLQQIATPDLYRKP